MDLNDVRGIISVVILMTFLGLFVWTWMGRADRFSDAAGLPFADDDDTGSNRTNEEARER